jgi:hypothetical protein
MDNASNNDALARYLPILIPSFRGMAACGRCFPHIINLLAKVHFNTNGTNEFSDFHIFLLSTAKEETSCYCPQ